MAKGLFYTNRDFVPIYRRSRIAPLAGAIVEGSITFGIEVDQQSTLALTSIASATFLISLTQTQTNVADRPVSFSTTINLSQLESNTATSLQTALFNLDATQEQTNVKVTGETLTFTTDLNYSVLNQLIAEADVTLAADLSYDILSQMVAESSIDFDAIMDQTQINQLAANVTVTLGTDLDFLGVGDGAGEVSAAITFLANLDQVQTNTLTGDKAVSLIMNASAQFDNQLNKDEVLALVLQASDQYQATRAVPGEVTLAAELDQSQSNTLDKLLLVSFNALMDKNLSTAGSTFGGAITFANVLATQFGTEGDVQGEVTFSTDMGQTSLTNKITDVSMGFDVDASLITEIKLIVDGQISLSTVMDQTEAKQLLGQSGITFGHVHGLASIGSADFGAAITFGTIQNVEVSGFNIQFEIFTPDSRTLKVYIEDRTILVDGDTRVTTIRKT